MQLLAFTLALISFAQTADLEGAWQVTLLDPPRPHVEQRMVFPPAAMVQGRHQLVLDGQCWDLSVGPYRFSGYRYEAPCQASLNESRGTFVNGVREGLPPTGTLAGIWEGEVNYGSLMTSGISRFRMEVQENNRRWTGFWTELERTETSAELKDGELAMVKRPMTPRGRREPVRKITRIGPRTFRFETTDGCWNVEILADTFDGLANGGPCTPTGLGTAARLNPVSARRTR